ncbi:hypothetical protein J1605_001878 [Eschrichtius robustus]|uniref:Uncharacterized protein n=1 Tax=Eschrichtius robustus TaxID=9764 RepID=A0AB34I0Z1_ESCRO|nr:hypothetical protein J1605_001878 [Eschrichtius robustus]
MLKYSNPGRTSDERAQPEEQVGVWQPSPCVLTCSDFSASLVMQWLRIRLPIQGTRVRALVREDPTCRGATEPVRRNY